jgi:hypothetical protein
LLQILGTCQLNGADSVLASKFSEIVTGGWNWILSDLKTLLETGAAMSA